jgi:RimJ/RimL family protein N-acetyltransferase
LRCALREVRDEDLAVLFEQWADPVAAHMAAFTAPDHMDRDAFERRWARLRADETVIVRVIVVDGEVAGSIGSWGDPDEREVTYWIGRSYWGKGIATGALNAFLTVDPSRPLRARVADDNVASRHVLEKCGFRVVATERGFAEARSGEIENSCCGLRTCPSEGLLAGEHVPDRLGESAGEVDLGAALSTDAGFRLLIALR